MSFAKIFQTGEWALSYELFPPKSDAAEAALYENLQTLFAFRPQFVTCTYGAGGSTQAKTLDVIGTVRDRHRCPVASHLTCVGSTVAQLRDYLAEAWARGVENIVALRGDPPQGQTAFQAVAGGLRYANELVALIKREFPQFGIAVAGYPETHQEAPSAELDLENLKRKVDAGADVIITQLFYDNADFFRFRERCDVAGIKIPIVPGILPVTNLAQIQRIASLCKARLPDSFLADLTRCVGNEAAQFEVGVTYAARQVQELLNAGAPGIHFYVLNKSQATAHVLSALKR